MDVIPDNLLDVQLETGFKGLLSMPCTRNTILTEQQSVSCSLLALALP